MPGKHHRKAKQPKPLGKSEYKDLVAPMHLELVRMAEWLQAEGRRLVVLIEGRAEVITPKALDDDAFRGAMEVISRAALLERTGGATDLAEAELSMQAAALDTAVTELGG